MVLALLRVPNGKMMNRMSATLDFLYAECRSPVGLLPQHETVDPAPILVGMMCGAARGFGVESGAYSTWRATTCGFISTTIIMLMSTIQKGEFVLLFERRVEGSEVRCLLIIIRAAADLHAPHTQPLFHKVRYPTHYQEHRALTVGREYRAHSEVLVFGKLAKNTMATGNDGAQGC